MTAEQILEMQQRLAEAMGWTDVREELFLANSCFDPPFREWGFRGQPPGHPDECDRCLAPRPVEYDDDAALLRAWCLGQGWLVELRCDQYMAVANVREYVEVILGEGMVHREEDPDPRRRERLALCRAVIQAIQAEEVGAVATAQAERDSAHRAGQEAMRERCAQWLLARGDTVWAAAIRALEVQP